MSTVTLESSFYVSRTGDDVTWTAIRNISSLLISNWQVRLHKTTSRLSTGSLTDCEPRIDPLLYDRLIRRFQSAEEREKEGKERGYSGSLEADLTRSEAKIEALNNPDPASPLAYVRATDGSITAMEQDVDDRAQTRESGWEMWKDAMTRRFLRGDDSDFAYETVDTNEDYDDRDEQDRAALERYLDEEEESFVGVDQPTGETGIQDF